MEEKIAKRVKKAIEEKVFPGCVIGVVYKNGKRLILPFGTFTYEKNSSIIKTDSIFDAASITKSIPTSSLALQLIDQKRLTLDAQVISLIPELKTNYKDQITIKHLLTYTLDFDLRLSLHKDKSADEILNLIYAANLKNLPGTTFSYNNATAILLGILIERIYKENLDILSDKLFFKPLGMKRTTFHPQKLDETEIIPTEIDNWRNRIIHGEIHDESAWKLREKMIAGSAGIFSTVPNLLNFLEMLLNNGMLNGKKYFSEEIIKQMSQGLGWESYQPRYMGKFCSTNTFGKTGFTGCMVLCNLENQIGIAMLSNYTFPTRKPNATLINNVRSNLADIIFEAYS